MGDAVSAISNPRGLGQQVNSSLGINNNSFGGQMIQSGGDAGFYMMNSDFLKPGDPPPAPDTNPNLAKVQQAQVGAYNNFTKNMPTMQNQMGNQARQGFNQQAGGQIRQNRAHNSSRGLLYGGLNQGQEAGIQGRAAVNTANAQGKINAGLLNSQSQLRGNAVSTGLSIQQNKQQIQDDIYQQAVAQMQASAGMFGAFTGSLGKVGGLMAAGA